MKKRLAILGSTGSIGKQCLKIVRENPNDFEVVFLSCNKQLGIIQEQVKAFQPRACSISDRKSRNEFAGLAPKGIECYSELTELPKKLVKELEIDVCINGISGWQGLRASEWALQNSIHLALANKESMVIDGTRLITMAKENNAYIIPIDSEISAIQQCLKGEALKDVKTLYLTASGGPFWGKHVNNPTIDQVLKHPTWSMGAQISVDSATLVNKAFEVIEAHRFFSIPIEDIKVLIHPQSFVHGMLEFKDGNIKSLMGSPNMKIHLSTAMYHPHRGNVEMGANPILQHLEFHAFDVQDHPHYKLALQECLKGPIEATAFVVVNQFFTELFLNESIPFEAIYTETLHTCEALSKSPTSDIVETIDKTLALCRDRAKDLGHIMA